MLATLTFFKQLLQFFLRWCLGQTFQPTRKGHPSILLLFTENFLWHSTHTCVHSVRHSWRKICVHYEWEDALLILLAPSLTAFLVWLDQGLFEVFRVTATPLCILTDCDFVRGLNRRPNEDLGGGKICFGIIQNVFWQMRGFEYFLIYISWSNTFSHIVIQIPRYFW